MGRSGITYAQVADAAAQLLDQGRSPTVDDVRARLGTGSKSTLAPLLKRWKAASADLVAGAETGLPATLLQAVHTLHQGMQHDLQQQLATRDGEHAAQQAATQQRGAALEADYRQLQTAHAALFTALQAARTELARLQTEQHADALRMTALASDNHGLNARLAERAIQLAALTHHLDQSRHQFEHFQEASARQRSQERQTTEQRVQLQEQAIRSMQQQLASLHASGAQLAEQVGLLQADNERLDVALRSRCEQAAALQAGRDQVAFQYQEVERSRDEMARQREKDQIELERLRAALADQQQATWLREHALQLAQSRIVALQMAQPMPEPQTDQPPSVPNAAQGELGLGQPGHGTIGTDP